MTKTIAILGAALMLSVALPASTQSVAWQKSFYSSGNGSGLPGCKEFYPQPGSQAVDSAGNLFVTGCNGKALQVYKLSGATGAVLWNQAYVGNPATGVALAVDASGNVIVTGSYTGPTQSNRIITLKYNGATGALMWTAIFLGTGGPDSAYGLALDAQGNAIVTGETYESSGGWSLRTIKYDGTTGAQLWTASYGGASSTTASGKSVIVDRTTGDAIVTGTGLASNMVTIRYSAATGAQLWVASTPSSFIYAVRQDAAGNVIAIGSYYDSANSDNFRVVKYNGVTGGEMWNVTYDGADHGSDQMFGLAIDAAGNAYITGQTREVCCSVLIRTMKLNGSTGAILWSSSPQLGGRGYAVAVNNAGQVVVTGVAQGYDSASNFYQNIETIRYDATTGAEAWKSSYGSPVGSAHFGQAVVMDASGNVFATGTSESNGSSSTAIIRSIKYNGATGAALWNITQPQVPTSASVGASGSWTGAGVYKPMAVDASGNLVVTGRSIDAAGGENIRTIKYDAATGAELWSVAMDGSASGKDRAYAVAVDSSGNVAVTGFTTESTGGQDMRTIKYNGANGNTLWSVRYGGSAGLDDQGVAVACDAAGNVVALGVTQESGAGKDMRIIKYNGNTGAVVWSVAYSNAAKRTDVGYALALDAAGNAIVVGSSTESSGALNMRTIKLDAATGTTLWNATLTSGYDSEALAVAVDAQGNVAVTGYFAGTMRTIKYSGATGSVVWDTTSSYGFADEGSSLAFDSKGNVVVAGFTNIQGSGDYIRTTKLNGSTGAQMWTASYQGSSGITGTANQANAVAVDASDNVIVSGFSHEIDTAGALNVRTIKYSGSNGTEIWNLSYNGSEVGGVPDDYALGVVLGQNGAIFIAGSSWEAGKGQSWLVQKIQDVPVANPPRLANISTRAQLGTGNNVMIAGFIIGGSAPKTVVIRARGPSMAALGVPGTIADPVLQLFSGQTQLAVNDNWQQAANAATVQSSGFAPSDSRESAIYTTLNPGAYTAIVTGANGTTGVGLVEVFEVDHPEIPLANIATRGQVLTGSDVMIAGFIIQGSGPQTIAVRARGPSLAANGIANFLANPSLQLVRGSDNATIATNDNWATASNAALLTSSGFAPSDPLEAAVLITLDPGAYTAIVTGSGGGTGIGIVELFAAN